MSKKPSTTLLINSDTSLDQLNTVENKIVSKMPRMKVTSTKEKAAKKTRKGSPRKKLAPDMENSKVTDEVASSSSQVEEKASQCNFREFGDFWPYMELSEMPDREKHKRFYLLVENPEFLRPENRRYLSQVKLDVEERNELWRKEFENIEDDGEFLRNEKIKAFEREFKDGEYLVSKSCPNYYEYLKSEYATKKVYSHGDDDNEMKFKKAIIHTSKQPAEYLKQMEATFKTFMENFQK